MSYQQEILFERLVPRYQKIFGHEPDVAGLSLDEALDRINADLAKIREGAAGGTALRDQHRSAGEIAVA
jgi:hypothetical protein